MQNSLGRWLGNGDPWKPTIRSFVKVLQSLERLCSGVIQPAFMYSKLLKLKTSSGNERLASPMCINLRNDCRFPISVGRVPVKKVDPRLRPTRLDKRPISLGMLPDTPVNATFKNARLVSMNNSVGSLPTTDGLKKRSSVCRPAERSETSLGMLPFKFPNWKIKCLYWPCSLQGDV